MQVRNRGTIGGSVAHADPAADYLPVLVALDAAIVVASTARDERAVPSARLLPRRDDDRAPARRGRRSRSARRGWPRAGSAYVRLARVEGSFAIVNAAAIVDGERSALAIGGAVPAPVVVQVDLNSI